MAWTEELGAGRNHSIVLMPSKGVTDFQSIMDSAIRAFAKVDVLRDAEGIHGHPEGPNSMMRQAVWHMQTSNLGPWMFCEPDNILLASDALDIWEREYRAYGKPFMGEFRPAHDVTPDYLSGNMMLPKDALIIAPMLGRRGLSKDGVELAFDIVAASQTLPQAHLTKLLHQVPKPRDGEGHTFPDQASLNIIRDGAVMFHPCKDGSLVDRLRERKNGACVSGLNVSASRDAQEPEGRIKTPPDWPGGSIPSAPTIEDLDATGVDVSAVLIVQGCGSDPVKLAARIYELERICSRYTELLNQRNGGDAPCADQARPAALKAPASEAAPTSEPAARRKKKTKRVISAAGKLALQEAARKAREAKARKVKA